MNRSEEGVETLGATERARIAADPDFRKLVRQRTALGLVTTLLTMAIYFGYLGLLAFAPNLMRRRVAGVITASFPIGVAVMAVTILIVVLYVWLASTRLERLAAAVNRRSHA